MLKIKNEIKSYHSTVTTTLKNSAKDDNDNNENDILNNSHSWIDS